MNGAKANYNISQGKITSGVREHTLQLKIIDFIEEQLPLWRNDKNRKYVESEPLLNPQLSSFLSVQAKHNFPAVCFNHEQPQNRNRTVDITTSLSESAIIEAQTYSIYDAVLVIECKRLPAPKKDREKEYVTGTNPNKKSGGIQRFKLGLHGAKHNLAVMIGYIQNDFKYNWPKTINGWIKEFTKNPIGDGCNWSSAELLCLINKDNKNKTIRCISKHERINSNTNTIELFHLWISMNNH